MKGHRAKTACLVTAIRVKLELESCALARVTRVPAACLGRRASKIFNARNQTRLPKDHSPMSRTLKMHLSHNYDIMINYAYEPHRHVSSRCWNALSCRLDVWKAVR